MAQEGAVILSTMTGTPGVSVLVNVGNAMELELQRVRASGKMEAHF
jgi:hypothetical protein